MNYSLSSFAPENLVSRDGFGVVSTYICTGTILLFLFVYIPGTSIFLFGNIYIRARFTVVVYQVVCIHICVTTAACVCRTMLVCMALATGQGCQSCSWSAAEQGK